MLFVLPPIEERKKLRRPKSVLLLSGYGMLRCAVICVLLAGSAAAAESSRGEVTNLPGWGAPPTKHYSGFVEVDAKTDTNLFYYYVEQGAGHGPARWFNGGPSVVARRSLQ